MSRWWAVALLSLSVGLNLGLAVAVVQQRLAPAPQPASPTVIVMPSPAAAAPVESVAGSAPAPVNEVAPPSVAVASPIGTALPHQRQQQQRPPREAPAEEPLVPLEKAFDLGPPDGHYAGEPGSGGPGGSGAGLRGGGPSPARLDELARRLGVPERDRPRFVELQVRFLAETKTRRIQLETVRQGLRGELTAPEPNTQRLHALVDASARLQGALERAFVEHVLQAREILDGDAEQRYLKFLARLGPRAVAGIGPPPPGQGRPLDPRWQRGRPFGGRGGAFGGGRRPPPGGQRAPFGEPAPSPN